MTNPALAPLEVLVGDWAVTLRNAAFLEDGASMSGTLSVSWLDDAFLVLRQSMAAGGPPDSVCVIGRNENRADYEVLYADDRGVSRVYRMEFEAGRWTQHREDPGFHQRFEATVAVDGAGVRGAWALSRDDGITWEHDFDLEYTRS